MTAPTFVITRSESGKTLAEVLRHRLQQSWKAVRQLIRHERVQVNGRMCRKPAQVLHKGQRVAILAAAAQAKTKPEKAKPPKQRRPEGPQPVLRFVDKHIVVVDKPAGLTTVRHAGERAEFGRRAQKYLPPTLADLLPELLARQEQGKRSRVRAVHRLDRDTSGLVVFARTAAAERHLGQQMRAHSIERKYLALVRGQARTERLASNLVEDRGDGRRGSTDRPGEGKRAVTQVQLLEVFGAFSLVECRLETGRTHQVRIHLGERGTPLCGERIYDRPLHGRPVPDTSGAARPMLHASSLGIEHPATGERLHWTAPLPADMVQLQSRLRKQQKGPPSSAADTDEQASHP